MFVQHVVEGVFDERSVVGVKEQLGGNDVISFGRSMSDKMKLSVRIAGADGRAIRRPFSVEDGCVTL